MRLRTFVPLTPLLAPTVATPQAPSQPLARQVYEAESAFAHSLAARDSQAFATYVALDAVFFDGAGALRGRQAVVTHWRAFFAGPAAPFSWSPDVVEVLESGGLALSTGPVRDPAGRRIGTFNSVWRRDADGKWRVIFDKGCRVCDCKGAP